MQKAPLFAVGKICLTVYRKTLGQYVDGFYQEGDSASFSTWANVQPVKYNDLMLLPEQSRTSKTIKVYTRCEIRTAKEGSYDADEFEWDGDRYRVMRVQSYKMGILNHYKSIAERIEITPG